MLLHASRRCNTRVTLKGAAWLCALALQASAAAQVTAAPSDGQTAAEPSSHGAAEADASPTTARAPTKVTAVPRSELEGAIGLLLHYNPAYPGASDYKLHVNPAGFLRWGRFTISGAGGFTTRRSDEVERGLGIELVQRTQVQVKLGLRFDNGRSESASPRLAGLGDIRKTVRARLSARWDIDEHWQANAGVSTDVLNRVGGYVVDLSLARQWRLSHASQLTVSAGLSGAGDRYMQAWHGVTPEQSAASGLPVYRAAEGLRDMNLSAVWRKELSPRWAGYLGLAGSRLLGPALDSPLTLKTSAWLASGALVWRF